jgi:hypothetical protein
MALTHDCMCQRYKDINTGWRQHKLESGTLVCMAQTHLCSCYGQIKEGPKLCKADITIHHRCSCVQNPRQCKAFIHDCVCKSHPSHCRVSDTEHICACDFCPSVCKSSGPHGCKCTSTNLRATKKCKGLDHPCVCHEKHHVCCQSMVCKFKGG